MFVWKICTLNLITGTLSIALILAISDTFWRISSSAYTKKKKNRWQNSIRFTTILTRRYTWKPYHLKFLPMAQDIFAQYNINSVIPYGLTSSKALFIISRLSLFTSCTEEKCRKKLQNWWSIYSAVDELVMLERRDCFKSFEHEAGLHLFIGANPTFRDIIIGVIAF